MQPWQQRVIDEKKELDEKLKKLLVFISGEEFRKLPWQEATLLKQQALAMGKYASILEERIANFK